jgi:hypothetical protein
MNLSSSHSPGKSLSSALSGLKPRPGTAFGLIILSALISFEVFNYTTTDFALRDLLGELKFAGVYWATILTIAFCAIDFAGIARLFTPEQGNDEPKEVWFLLGAWLLAATMNAVLTWWGVSMAIANHALASTAIVDQKTLLDVVPVFVALMVWIIRICIIGSLSIAGDRLFNDSPKRPAFTSNRPARSMPAQAQSSLRGANLSPRQPVSRPGFSNNNPGTPRPEPTYHNMQARGQNGQESSTKGDSGHNYRL